MVYAIPCMVHGTSSVLVFQHYIYYVLEKQYVHIINVYCTQTDGSIKRRSSQLGKMT